jgi:hypothetical protein
MPVWIPPQVSSASSIRDLLQAIGFGTDDLD